MDFETADGSQFSLRPVYKADDQRGGHAFDYTSVTAVVQGDAYAGRLDQKPEDVDDADAMQCLGPVPLENIYPTFQPDITRAPDFDARKHYLKAPSFLYEDAAPGNTFVADCFWNEVTVLETLRRRPHTNLAKYHGCVVRNDRIVQICLERYQCSLVDYLDDLADRGALSSAVCKRLLYQIAQGIQHLNDVLGMAHNDINEHNICIDAAGDAIVVDFDSCLPFGVRLMKGDAAGREPVSDRTNDLNGLNGIADLLDELSEGLRRETDDGEEE